MEVLLSVICSEREYRLDMMRICAWYTYAAEIVEQIHCSLFFDILKVQSSVFKISIMVIEPIFFVICLNWKSHSYLRYAFMLILEG